MVMWFSDIFNIILNTYKYRIQKEGFIFAMNIETRAKLGEKYVDLELYKKPWWVKFKVWCQKKKRGYEEWKHDHRQRMIEKEKAKLAKKEEQEKIEAEIAAHEEKENAEIAKRSNLVVDQKTLDELKSFGDNVSNDTKVLKAEPKKEKNKQDSKIEESSKEEKKEVKPKAQKAKVSVKTNSKKSASKKNNSKKK